MTHLGCPLCGAKSVEFAVDARRTYFRCSRCELTFANPASHLDRAAERAVYDQHENAPSDARYRAFLSQLAAPLLSRLRPGMKGLDYGCGPGPTLSVMLEEAGMEMQLYDPHYAPDMDVLESTYDFVTCSETVEHFYKPSRDWDRMVSLLRRGGWLAIMTRLVDDSQRFDQWYYKNDPTHVSFYNSGTFAWLGMHYGLTIDFNESNVVVFQRT